MPTKKFSEFDPSGNIIRLVGLFDSAGTIKNGITDPMRVITQTEYDVLNAKAPTLNATFTGTTKVDQPAETPDNAEVATVKYVADSIAAIPAPPIPVAATLAPLVDNATPEVGISESYAREDHVHPTNPNLALLSGATFSGAVEQTAAQGTNATSLVRKDYVDTRSAMRALGDAPAILTVDLTTGTEIFTATLIQPLTEIQFTSGTIPAGHIRSFMLSVTQGTGANDITWPTNVKWSYERNPVLTFTVDKTDILQFMTFDNGVSWFGSLIIAGV